MFQRNIKRPENRSRKRQSLNGAAGNWHSHEARLSFQCDALEPRLLLTGDLPDFLLLSVARDGFVENPADESQLSFGEEDIIRYSTVDSSWDIYFDGSDVGLQREDIDAFHVLDDGDLLISLASPADLTLAGGETERISTRDVLRFTPESLGDETSGEFTVYLRGEDHELTTAGENVDGLGMTEDGRLLVSTSGNFRVADLRGGDEDLIAIDITTGDKEIWFDGSEASLNTGGEDVGALAINDGSTHVITRGTFRIPVAEDSAQPEQITGRNGDILQLEQGEEDITSVLWSAASVGLASKFRIDGLAFSGGLGVDSVERSYVIAERPLVVQSPPGEYTVLPIYGASLLPLGDLTISTTLSTTDTGGISIRTDAGNQELLLTRSGGNWILLSQSDGEFETLLTFQTAELGGNFEIQFQDDFTAVTVIAPDGEELTHDFSERFFGVESVIRLHSFVGPASEVSIESLSTTQSNIPAYDTLGSVAPSLAAAAAEHGIDFGGFPDTWTGSPQHDRLMTAHTELFTLSFAYPDDFDDPAASFVLRDSQVSYAVAQGWRIRGHGLVWHPTPAALEGQIFTRDELIAEMKNFIQNTISAYPEVDEWVVVNEPVEFDGTLRESIWQQTIGDDYLNLAFEFAREVADADDILLINDYAVDIPGEDKSDAYFQLVTNLLAEGVPIDAVGLQSHLGLADLPIPTYFESVSNFQRFAALGVEVHVTELDVNAFYLDGTAAEKETLQAAIYGDYVRACVDSGVCSSITIWGFSDPFSWLHDPVQNQAGGESPLPFDADFAPKEAFWSILDALSDE